jgi:hypothetical protein
VPDHPTIPIHPESVHKGDVIGADPDHPDQQVAWEVTAEDWEGPVRIVEYRIQGGTEGRHAWPDPQAWVRVRVPRQFDHQTAA